TREQARGRKRFDRNPVFDEAEVQKMADAGVRRLADMQVADGGWGWFSGGESWPHTTAVVVHGLQLARQSGMVLPHDLLERGVKWLKEYQDGRVARLRIGPSATKPTAEADENLDALVYRVLVDAGVSNPEMRGFLYRDRGRLTVYAKALFGLALHAE